MTHSKVGNRRDDCRLQRHQTALVGQGQQALEADERASLDGDEVLRRVSMLFHGLGHLGDRLRFGFGLPQTGLGQTLGLQNS